MTDAPRCPYCGQTAELVSATVVYGAGRGKDWGKVWACPSFPSCNAYIGCHEGTDKPLGRLADYQLRRAKNAAHAAFDRLWRAKIAREGCSKSAARAAGYRWLSEMTGIPPDQCHIGMMDIEQCNRVVEICGAVRLSRKKEQPECTPSPTQ